MPNFLQKAALWTSNYREAHASDTIVWTDVTHPSGVSMPATISSDTAETNPNGVKIQTKHVHFIIKASRIKANSIVPIRGATITWRNREFEVAFDKGNVWEWNDPQQYDIIVKTVYKRDLS